MDNASIHKSPKIREVIEKAGLSTWELRGLDLAGAAKLLEGDARWMVVPFGSAVHVSAARGNDLPAWLKQHAADTRWTVRPLATSLEDVFISLTEHAQDNFQ